MQLVSNVLVLLVLEAQVLALEVLAVESEDGLLISTDEQTWRHVPAKIFIRKQLRRSICQRRIPADIIKQESSRSEYL